MAGVPQVVAYRTGWLEAQIARRLITAETAVLANLVIGDKIVPEFLQEFSTIEAVTSAMEDIVADTPARHRQIDAFTRLDALMDFAGTEPSAKAAEIVLRTLHDKRRA